MALGGPFEGVLAHAAGLGGGKRKLQALTARGQLITIAEHLERPGVEWAGATSSPGGTTLYVSLKLIVAARRGLRERRR